MNMVRLLLSNIPRNTVEIRRFCGIYIQYLHHDLALAFFRRIWKGQANESTSTVTSLVEETYENLSCDSSFVQY